MKSPPDSNVAAAAAALRKRILATEDGTLIGKEGGLTSDLQISRNTLRQAARILELEGLIDVRRGIAGGYYALRPNIDTVKRRVSGYLHTLNVEPGDAIMISTATWVEAMRRAANAQRDKAAEVVNLLNTALEKLSPSLSFNEILSFEYFFRDAIFGLINSPYIKLIFDINVTFGLGYFDKDMEGADHPEDMRFISLWRHSVSLELATILDGDAELASIAARRARNIWNERVAKKRDLPPFP
jgi:DNA-binding FadR family transcriptional regulator